MSTSGKSNKKKKAQFPVTPSTTPDDEERTSKGKITAKQKGLKWTKNVPTSGKVYMPTKRDDSHMANGETGFLSLGHAEPTHAYDVGGEWKLLYAKTGDDDEDDDKPNGPGMKPRKKSKSPPPPSLLSPKKSPKPKKVNKNRSPKPSPKPRPKPITITSTHAVAVPPPPLPADPNIDIVIRCWNGTMFYLRNVTPEDTIEDIQLRIEREHDIPIENQRLRFVRQPLSDPDKTLKECNIEDQSMLDLDPMQINFRDPYKNVRHTLDVNPIDTIDDVKKKIFDKTGIPKNYQRLNFNRQPLLEKDDNKTLNDRGIKHDDILDLQPTEITVKAPDGRTTKLVVHPEDTIDDVKKQVYEKLAIPFVDQRPTFKGKALPDNSTLNDNNINHGDTINLQPMEITVKAPDGRTTKLVVSPEDTIDDVKKQVNEKLDIPFIDQRPTFKGKALPDNSTLNDNNINHGDTINLQPMEITVKAPDGCTTKLVVSPDDTIDGIKKQVNKKLLIPVDDQRMSFKDNSLPDKSTLRNNNIGHGDTIHLQPMEITVKAPDGRTTKLVVSPDDTIDDIKKQVNKKLLIPVDDQRMLFKDNSLPDKSTLRNNNIGHGDTINLQPMQLTVKAPDGRTINLVVSPDDTIDDIKKQVNKKLSIPVDDQRMSFKDDSLPDKSTLRNNNIGHGDTINLQPMIIYVIDLDGNEGTYTVDSSDKIKGIKSRVKDDTGVPKAQQRLTFKGTLLDDDISTLKDNGIKHKDTLRLEPFKIHIRLPEGNTITLDADPGNTTNDVKDMIKKREGILPKDQILSFDDTKLGDKIKLKDNNVQRDDTIDLTFPPPPPPRPKLKLVAPTEPYKSPYVPTGSRKEQLDRYGTVTVTTYKTRYDGEPGESVIDGVVSKATTKFKIEKPTLKSKTIN
jgi:ubiquitin C